MPSNSQILLDKILHRQHQDRLPESDFPTYFEIFTAQQVLKDFDPSYDEIESGLMGGSGDGGIDGIYFMVNGELVQEDTEYPRPKSNVVLDLYIFQSKTEASFKETPIERFNSFASDIFNLASASDPQSPPPPHYNPRVRSFITRFKQVYTDLAPTFPIVNVSFFYATRGESPSNAVKHKVNKLRETVHGFIPHANFEFKFLGAPELHDLVRRQPSTKHELLLAEIPISSGNQVGFIALVKLTDFHSFITDNTGSLQRHMFESNVRDYQGSTQVNEEIMESLQTSGEEDFWWLNNGVSVLASQASLVNKTLTIENPQIVNGLQTSTEVYKYCSELSERDDDRKILVRVMVPQEEESRDRIIKATNSQTALPLSSLRAAHKIHKDIEEHLHPMGLFYDRRKNFYKNAGKPKEQIVGIPYLAQAVMAIVLRKPDQARARPSSLLKNDQDYQEVFNPLYPIHVYYVCVEAMRRVEAHLKSPTLGVPPEERNNLRFYVAMHVVNAALGKSTPAPNQIASLDLDRIDEAAIQASLDFVRPIYSSLGATDQVAKGPNLLRVMSEDKPGSQLVIATDS